MSDTRCFNCQAEVSNGLALCDKCQQTLRVALVNVASFYTDVERIQPGQRVKVRSAYVSTPPPAIGVTFDPITVATCHVDAIVLGWARNLQDDRPAGQMPTTTPKVCGWLESHVASIATLEWAGEMVSEIGQCEHMLQRLLDRSDTGWYAGVCNNEIGREEIDDESVALACPRELYGTQSSAWVRCPECGRTWDAAARREAMTSEARDRTAPVRVIARIVVGLTDESSVERLTRRIEQWVRRGELLKAGTKVIDGRPRSVYRIGDAFDLVKGIKPHKSAA